MTYIASTTSRKLGEMIRAGMMDLTELDRAGQELHRAALVTRPTGFDDDSLSALFQRLLAQNSASSILDALLSVGATTMPSGSLPSLVASVFTGTPITQDGQRIPAHSITMNTAGGTILSAAGIVVASKSLLRRGGEAAEVALAGELLKAVSHSANAVIIGALTSVTPVPRAFDPVSDLNAGLEAAGETDGVVVAASYGVVRQLAVSTANRSGNCGAAGGLLAPGIIAVPVRGLDSMLILPASRIAVRDDGVVADRSLDANIDLSDALDGSGIAATFQQNLTALRGVREFSIAQAAPIIQVIGS